MFEAELVGGSEDTPVGTPEVETPNTETPAEENPDPAPAVEAEITPEETMLYETPDGRQVTAEVLQKEWKENFLPEFTRKSQELADLKRDPNINSPQKDEPEWKNPDYVPQNYAEVIELAKREAIAEIQNNAKAEAERENSIRQAVENELNTLKSKDANLSEDVLFAHATKYGFENLTAAYRNMVDMKKSIEEIERRTVKNLKDREADPISTGAGGAAPDAGDDIVDASQFDSAADYLNHLKKGS